MPPPSIAVVDGRVQEVCLISDGAKAQVAGVPFGGLPARCRRMLRFGLLTSKQRTQFNSFSRHSQK
jgi:hypothetical protein